MATLNQQLQKARNLSSIYVGQALFDFIRSLEQELTDLEKKRISIDSEDTQGNPLGYYSYWTEVISGGKKNHGDPFTGIDTGEWFDGFFAKIHNVGDVGYIQFGSKDPKTKLILESDNWRSDDIFGLTDEQLKEVVHERLLPFLLKLIREKLDI